MNEISIKLKTKQKRLEIRVNIQDIELRKSKIMNYYSFIK
jgi:hypothetical protein